MRKAGLTLKLEKCKFAQSSVTFVGHTIGSGLHGHIPHKVARVQDMKPTNSNKAVRQILRFFSYFRTYIDRFAEIAKPLTDLTRKQVFSKISWTSEHQRAFDLLKQSLCNAYKLHTFKFDKPCGLLVDASNIAVGCCLIQWTENRQEKPIDFASSKLTATQSAISTIEREAFAVIYALRKFRNLFLPLR